MLISSGTWTSSFFRVIVIGSDTMDWGERSCGDGGTIWVLPVITMESLAFRFLRFKFCLLMGVIVMSLFSISLRICGMEILEKLLFEEMLEQKKSFKREIC